MPAETITIESVRERLSAGPTPVLIDVRSPAEYAGVHAAGAVLMPLGTLDPAAVGARRPSPDTPVWVLCHSGARAARATATLRAAGLAGVHCVEGGTVAWEAAGLPVVRGSGTVISLERQVRIAAGSLVLIGVAGGWLIHPALFGLAGFVGAGLVFAGMTDHCGMGLLLARMPWNQRAVTGPTSGSSPPAAPSS